MRLERVASLAGVLSCLLCFATAQEEACGGPTQKTEASGPGWHVAIYDKKAGHKDICAGALIKPKYFITAAHCFDDGHGHERKPSEFEVAVGKTSRSWEQNGEGEQRRTIEHIHTLGFELKGLAHDVAVVELNKEVIPNDRIWPICIDWKEVQLPLSEGAEGFMAGWGGTDSLQSFTVRYPGKGQCSQRITKDLEKFVNEEKFCAENAKGPSFSEVDATCGFAHRTPEQQWFLKGVFSNASPETNLFVNVTEYTDWIAHVVSGEKDDME